MNEVCAITVQRRESSSEIFHESSKIGRRWSSLRLSAESIAVMAGAYKEYRLSPRVGLCPPSEVEVGMDVGRAIVRRRSQRCFSGGGLTFSELSQILWLSYGLRRSASRPWSRNVPSAGALYPLELYSICLQPCPGIGTVTHYNAKDDVLEELPQTITREEVDANLFADHVAETAAALLIVTGIFGRSKIKYGERGYRFALLEAGHVAQNICLVCTSLGLGVCPIGGFVDEGVNRLLRVDGVDEAAIYAVAIGTLGERGGDEQSARC